ncbi:MAG: GNAT family N-acetyltransferase [Armatimonadota bacterium]|nr:GNAT family N-acetyltransferase [Armatimonadota bacterium]
MLKPILRDFPDVIETERLIIRPPQPGDGRALNEAVLESLESLRPWMPWAREAPSVEDSEEYCRRSYAQWISREDLPLLLFLKDSDAVVGASGLHPRNWDVPSFEIGYWRRTGFGQRGYITEAVRAITHFGFKSVGARRIQIRCDSRNGRSQRVAERVGYQFEGEHRNNGLTQEGELRNLLVYSRISDLELDAGVAATHDNVDVDETGAAVGR